MPEVVDDESDGWMCKSSGDGLIREITFWGEFFLIRVLKKTFWAGEQSSFSSQCNVLQKET